MPRTLVRAPDHDRNRSLGWLAVAWMEYFCRHGPGDVQGQPVQHGDEFTGFIVDCYAVDADGRQMYDSAFFSRPKGSDKSGLGGRLGLFEALGPCRFLGWAEGGEVYEDPWGLGFVYVYEPGEPMGRPVTAPYIRCMATEEGQTGNVYDTVYFNLTDDEAPLAHVPGIDAGLTRIYLPGGGEITPSTASSASKDGGKETFVVFDEAMALDTRLPTPDGWTTMAEVKVGDKLIGDDGLPVTVIKTTDVFTDRDCYRVTFSDGTSIVASQGHLWMTGVVASGALPRIRTTAEMVEDGRKFKVPAAQPWKLPERDLDIDPYVLGAWLGDGDSRNATISVASADVEEMTSLIRGTGYTVKRCAVASGRAELMYVSAPGSHSNRFSPVRGLKVRLRDAGLLCNKHIPREYLRGSLDQRLALVQGLMDTDGHAGKRGNCTFVNSREPVVDGLIEALRSLGEDPVKTFVNDDRSRAGGYWRVTFTPRNIVPFRLARKSSRIRRDRTARDRWVTIRSIEKVDAVPVKCVAVDSPTHLFVAGDACKVTHNTHLYNQAELRRMYNTVTRNMRKRKKIAGTWFLETTTMFAAGEESIAEATYKLAEQIQEGRARRSRLLYDHRWGECEDLSAEDELREAIRESFGEALEWNDIDAIVDEFYDTRKDPVDSRRYFLNASTATSDAWLAPHEWAACLDVEKVVAGNERITLGFDGSRHRSRGVADATALVGCRVSDGHLFEIAVWEQSQGPAGDDWWVPTEEVEAAVRSAFARWKVVAFYADPAADWRSYVAGWEADYGRRLRVKSSQKHPIEWWMNRAYLVVRALAQFHSAVANGELTHDGSFALTRHVLNARRRPSRSGLQIAKENPDSPRKIDAAVAATLAWQARLDALAKGMDRKTASGRVVVLS